ncbi:MAG: 2-C-methyl-D-erythritol 4-phosphate cytidylyltransferase [Cellulosilyticaceae bacterium]
MKTGVIIVAGGKGTRIGGQTKKQYLTLGGKEILAHTIEAFEHAQVIDEMIVVVGAEDLNYVKEDIVEKYGYTKVTAIVAGGKERKDSVWNGICELEERVDYIMVHDGARPFIKEEQINACLESAMKEGAALIAVPVKDTIKQVGPQGLVVGTPERSTLWAVQTPQTFERKLLTKAHLHGQRENLEATDDGMLVEAIGHGVWVVEGDYTNIKITTPEDLVIGDIFIRK